MSKLQKSSVSFPVSTIDMAALRFGFSHEDTKTESECLFSAAFFVSAGLCGLRASRPANPVSTRVYEQGMNIFCLLINA